MTSFPAAASIVTTTAAETPALVLPFPVTAAARHVYRALAARADRQERHFIRRVRERYRFTLSSQRYRHWIQKVEQVLPGTEFLRPGACPGRTLWRIRSGSYTLHVVYDETTARLVTCFPPPFAKTPPRVRYLWRGGYGSRAVAERATR